MSLAAGVKEDSVIINTKCPPVGSHPLIIESIDLNSPLASPSVLKTDSIEVKVE